MHYMYNVLRVRTIHGLALEDGDRHGWPFG